MFNKKRIVSCALLLCVEVFTFQGRSSAGNDVVLFALNDAAAVESLRLHGGSGAASVAPLWFAAGPDGKLQGNASARLLEACRELGARVTPAVMNRDFSPAVASALLRSRRARARLAAELVARARHFQFSGYVIDFENLQASRSERGHFTELLRELRQAFAPQRLSLAVALPVPSARYRAAIDYRAVGRLANRVVLMAYDQHGRLNSPGPIAGYAWVESGVREILQLVAGEKLLLGLAFYHRNWGEAGATSGGYNEAVALLEQHRADWQWHPLHRAHWFGFVDQGRVHTVWLEDARSIAEKLALARRFGLAGVAGWRLGQEDPRVWVMLREFQANGN